MKSESTLGVGLELHQIRVYVRSRCGGIRQQNKAHLDSHGCWVCRENQVTAPHKLHRYGYMQPVHPETINYPCLGLLVLLLRFSYFSLRNVSQW